MAGRRCIICSCPRRASRSSWQLVGRFVVRSAGRSAARRFEKWFFVQSAVTGGCAAIGGWLGSRSRFGREHCSRKPSEAALEGDRQGLFRAQATRESRHGRRPRTAFFCGAGTRGSGVNSPVRGENSPAPWPELAGSVPELAGSVPELARLRAQNSPGSAVSQQGRRAALSAPGRCHVRSGGYRAGCGFAAADAGACPARPCDRALWEPALRDDPGNHLS